MAIAAAVTLGMQDEPKSLREQIGAPYDAGNGFFDYIDAAEIVRAADFSALEREYTELLNQKVKAKGGTRGLPSSGNGWRELPSKQWSASVSETRSKSGIRELKSRLQRSSPS